MNRVDEMFPIENFIIINYHQFINAELNNLNIEIEVPEELDAVQLSDYLESKYYGNIELFEKHQNDILKYDAVLIDEIQDYHRPWMDIIKNFFRDPQGDYVLFGDVKQNIYGQITQNKDVVTNVKGVNELKYCYRSDFKIRDLAQLFQKNIFGDKYDVDDFSENGTYSFFGHEQEKEGYINYMFLQNEHPITALYNIIRGNILNKNSNVSPNDITILGYTANLLREFDLYYRHASREKTNSMLETVEIMYMTHLNHIGKNKDNSPHSGWFNNICDHFKKKLFPNRHTLYDNDIIKVRQHVAVLFSIYDVYTRFTGTFEHHIEEECLKCGISLEAFMAFRKHYSNDLAQFEQEVYSDNYKNIRDNKKLHFWMNSGTLNISTINSIKGWESETVFLIIEPKYDSSNSFNLSFDELLYTGLTRCLRNLVIINFGNKEYDTKLSSLIKGFK
jgi:superfamily I DNA/RNA helicase